MPAPVSCIDVEPQIISNYNSNQDAEKEILIKTGSSILIDRRYDEKGKKCSDKQNEVSSNDSRSFENTVMFHLSSQRSISQPTVNNIIGQVQKDSVHKVHQND